MAVHCGFHRVSSGDGHIRMTYGIDIMSMNFDAILKQKSKKKRERKDIVLEVKLIPPTKDKYTEVNVAELIKEQLGSDASEEENDDNEEHRKLVEITKKLEEKYNKKKGNKGKAKKLYNADDYMDMGMGYDKEDSFIDDSEAYDELIPSTLDTKYGGFYVNRGPLEYVDMTASRSSGSSGESDEEDRTKEKKKEKSLKKKRKSNAIDDTIESIASTQLPLKFDQKMSVTASAGAKTIDSGKKTNSSQSISASCDVQGKMGNSSVPQVNSKSFALPKPRLSACPPSSSMMRKSNHKSDKIQKRKTVDSVSLTAASSNESKKFKAFQLPSLPSEKVNIQREVANLPSPVPDIQTPTLVSPPSTNGCNLNHLEDVISSVIQSSSAAAYKHSFDIAHIESQLRRSS